MNPKFLLLRVLLQGCNFGSLTHMSCSSARDEAGAAIGFRNAAREATGRNGTVVIQDINVCVYHPVLPAVLHSGLIALVQTAVLARAPVCA